MARTLSRTLIGLVSVAALSSACGGGETNTNNTKTNNTPGSLKVDMFSASAAAVASGASVSLSWRVSGAEDVAVTITRSPGAAVIEGATQLEGMVDSGPITETTTFTIAVTGAGQTVMGNPITVEVDETALSIVSFSATPNPAAPGADVTLAWQVAGATRVAVLEGTTELTSTDIDVMAGSYVVTLSEASHTYTLRAENAATSATETVTVITETPPEITTFTVSPNTFSGASADVTITFAAQGTTFALTANGAAVDGYGGEAAGNLTVTVTETTVFAFTASGAGQSATAMAAVAQATAEVEPNDDRATATPVTGGATASLPEGDVDWFSFTVPAGGNVYAETSDGMGGCNFTSFLSLYDDTEEAALTSAADIFGGACAQLDPRFDPAAADLAGGTYYIEIDTLGGNGDYALVILVGSAACGNGILEASTGEQCDDGNTADGDGCSATCQVNAAGMVSGNGQAQTFSESLSAGQSDYFQVTLPADGYIFAETGAPTIGMCVEPTDTVLTLFDGSFTELASNDDGDSLCSELTPASYGNTPLPAGTYWVQANAFDAGAAIPAYQVLIRTEATGCGNAVAEMGEQCDDGNTMSGDGCDASCQIELAGTVSGAGGMVNATLGTPEDFPAVIQIDVTAGQSITATTTSANGTCPFPTTLTLIDSSFTTNYGGASGNGGCAFIDPANDTWATNLPAGSYLLIVATESGMGGSVRVDVTIGDAVCGNTNVETLAGEQCDDGNMANGDGCSSSCQFEGNVLVEMEPNDMPAGANALSVTPGGGIQTASGDIDPVGDVDYFSFTIASGTASLVASTYPTFGDPTSCNFDQDTLLQLYDAQGTLLAENDDDPNRSGFCSQLDASTDMAAGGLAAGTYYVVVRHYDDTRLVPAYLLDVSLVTP